MHEVSTATLAGAYSLREAQGRHLFLETGGYWFWGIGYGGGVSRGAPAGADIACFEGGCGYGGSDNIALFDLANPAKPSFITAARVSGWIMSIVVDGSSLYLPTGNYGIQTVKF